MYDMVGWDFESMSRGMNALHGCTFWKGFGSFVRFAAVANGINCLYQRLSRCC
jgi:hypothetical protein